ncbi:hypothetical protein AGABI1DRAFT_116709 [Agaricus bisporus var. burnettii JB137-S8]|uniref:Uncharacterized protein n=1 Tax=Agaricus bisporus var. burnettii (strain JB137-S8 / ATCC MYA-4627 / FGSC 10392) TaxID=597362 RepID=K5WW96_AGABU|nr:uncharacterized protein AGABI1DRAFT_116709 [Agaricus bisporus var. burnettii JB137-S8]EKM74842.1 hypothetical protein AGABI1DRAFT_116709 [Agaricus bisporus var. burnettii JB137-S8]
MAQAAKRVLVLAGVGSTSGTGAATARRFAKERYHLALLSRHAPQLQALEDEISNSGGHVTTFPLRSYSYEDMSSAWDLIRETYGRPSYNIRAAIFNAGQSVFKPFMEITQDEIQQSLEVSVTSAFSFSREAISSFSQNEIEETSGKRGTLIFTGATASVRGNTLTSLLAAGKFGARALSQSLAKEFGQNNIHVAHVIIDGKILTERTRQAFSSKVDQFDTNQNIRLNPESVADAFAYLTNQDRSAWTWELDLRPAHERW